MSQIGTFYIVRALILLEVFTFADGTGKDSKNSKNLDFDTIVIGAGIIGSGSAYKIAQSGRRTLLLEQYSLDHKWGSSHGGSRIIRLTHSQPHWVPLAQDAYREWDKLHAADGGEPLYTQNGLVTLDPDFAQTQKRADVLRAFGVPHEVLRGGAAIQRRFPHLCNYGEEWSALYEPGAGTLWADRCMRTVQKHFLAHGKHLAQIRDNEEVLEIVPKESEGSTIVEVRTTKGTYLAENVVVATGAWLSRLLPDLPLRVVPYLVGVDFWRVKSRPELFRIDQRSPILLSFEQGHELFAMPDADFPGLIKFAVHFGLELDNMEKRVEVMPPEWAHTLVSQHLAKHMPDLDHTEPAVKHTCIYSMTDDLQFIVDRHPAHPRSVFIASGFSGTGFKFGLTIGTVMAAWVNGQPAPAHLDMSPFRLDRIIDADADRPKL